MICGEKSEYPVCDCCIKDEKKVKAHLREVKELPFFSKSKFVCKNAEPELLYVPQEALRMILQILDEEKDAKQCLSFGVYAIFYYGDTKVAVVHKESKDVRLDQLQQRVLTLSVAKHFEQQAEIEK